MAKTIHYEVLWEMVENVATPKHPNTLDNLKNLSTLVKDLTAIQQTALENPKSEIAHALKTKAIGQILFQLTAISGVEKIDVYSALKSEYESLLFQDQLKLKLAALDQSLEEIGSSSDGESVGTSISPQSP